MALRLSLFAVTTPLGREPALTGARPHVSSAAKCSTPTGVWSLRVPAVCAIAHVATAVARADAMALLCHCGGSAQASLGVTQSTTTRRWAGATLPHQCHGGGSAGIVRYVGLSGRPPKFPSRGVQGLGNELLLPLRWHSRATAVALLPGWVPWHHLQQHSHCRVRALGAHGRCHRRQICSAPAPVGRLAAGLAQAERTCHTNNHTR